MEPFNLSPLQRYRASDLVRPQGSDRLQSFLLALSVVFNDLKGILLFQKAYAHLKPAANEVSPQAGEWRGLEIQLQRYTLALVHELLTLIQTFEAEASGPEVNEWMRDAHPEIRSRWQRLLRVATGRNTRGDPAFTKVLVQIRNNISSHYYQPKVLVAGFRRHFFEAPKTAMNDVAFASVGRNMEQTRFYFADAALQAAMGKLSGSLGEKGFARRARRTATDINETLAHLLTKYIEPAKTE
jgi:hypothetical protein